MPENLMNLIYRWQAIKADIEDGRADSDGQQQLRELEKTIGDLQATTLAEAKAQLNFAVTVWREEMPPAQNARQRAMEGMFQSVLSFLMVSHFKVDVRLEDGYAVIQTDRYLGGPMSEDLAEAARELMRRGYDKLVINLRRTPLINSIGISVLIEIIELFSEQGGVLHFCHLSPTVERAFGIAGISRMAHIFLDENSAISRLT